jgi:hypothetical protein
LKYLFMPFVIYLCATVFYTSFLWQKTVNEKTENWLVNFVVEETIVVLSLYFLGLEMLQIKDDGLNYFKTIWNWIDIIPPCIQISIAIFQMNGYYLDFNDKTDEGHENRRELAIMLSIASLCLWFKFLYFLRIFDGTGFLIRAILAVIVDMKYFLLILLIAMMAFGDSFKVMSMANVEGKEFI